MAHSIALSVKYWGTTGTISAPLSPAAVQAKIDAALELRAAAKSDQSSEHSGVATFGGHTTCVEVRTPDAEIVLDCGTGICGWGRSLSERWNSAGNRASRHAHILVTHPHLDHIEGLAFVGLLYDPANHFTLWASRSTLDTLEGFLDPKSPLSGKLFPPTYAFLHGLKEFREIQIGSSFEIGTTRIRTFALNHPGGCLAYRLENAGKAYVFATDHEHSEVPDRRLAEFARDAEVIYMDGQYLSEEYEGRTALSGEQPVSRRGWGHSTVEACVATARAAHVKSLHIGHREPVRTDEQTALVEKFAQQLMREASNAADSDRRECEVLIPYEGLTCTF